MIRFRVIFRVLGVLLMVYSCAYLPPMVVSGIYDDGSMAAFVYSFLITFTIGALFWVPVCRERADLRTRDGFLITVLFWFVLSLFGSLPFLLSDATPISAIDALFESVSGLTTTGATVMVGLDRLPESLLFYRQLIQWLGGIGIVVIAVAILPMLGVGGMKLYRAETPGPVKDTKLTPRIAETAKFLFFIYVCLTVACAYSYWLVGMSPFDAISHSFTTVATAGFSTHDASLGHFDSTPVLMVSIVFMVLGGFNFALHYYTFAQLIRGRQPFARFHFWRISLRRFSLRHYWQESEARLYMAILVGSSAAVVLALLATREYAGTEALVNGVFTTVSVVTTTGFGTDSFASWPAVIGFFLIFLSFFGACAGSTGGGIKIGRMQILAKQTLREMARLVHPNGVFPVKIGAREVDSRITDSIWGFFGAYLIIFYFMVLVLLATGLDYVTAWSSVAATLNNLGPGLGEVGSNYASINGVSKLVLCLCMLLGRLEIFTLLVLVLPMFWRK